MTKFSGNPTPEEDVLHLALSNESRDEYLKEHYGLDPEQSEEAVYRIDQLTDYLLSREDRGEEVWDELSSGVSQVLRQYKGQKVKV